MSAIMRDEEVKHLTNGQNAQLPNHSRNLLVLTQIDLSQLLLLQLHSKFLFFVKSTTTKSINQTFGQIWQVYCFSIRAVLKNALTQRT